MGFDKVTGVADKDEDTAVHVARFRERRVKIRAANERGRVGIWCD